MFGTVYHPSCHNNTHNVPYHVLYFLVCRAVVYTLNNHGFPIRSKYSQVHGLVSMLYVRCGLYGVTVIIILLCTWLANCHCWTYLARVDIWTSEVMYVHVFVNMCTRFIQNIVALGFPTSFSLNFFVLQLKIFMWKVNYFFYEFIALIYS